MKQYEVLPLQISEAKFFANELIHMTPWKELEYKKTTLNTYFTRDQEGFQSFCLHVNNTPAGIITLRTPWLKGELLELLAILPKFQNQGLGKWIMQWILFRAKQENKQNIWTLVSNFNLPAIHFYKSQGFIQIGQLDNYIINGSHEYLLRKVIDY